MADVYSRGRGSGLVNRPAQEWRRSTSDYRRLASFTFSKDDFGHALMAFDEEGGPLDEAPFDAVGSNTVLVPKEAVEAWSEWLHDRGILFAAKAVRESHELPAEEIAALRARNYRPAP